MKILAIRGENIASLERFELDFRAEPLRSAGIFAITGPTGSGKSTILDALCLALFQEAPRLEDSEREGKFASAYGEIAAGDVRHLLRRGASTGMAECEFRAVDGLEYRARWGYRAPKRKGSSVQEELSLERLEDGQILVSGQNRKGEFRKRCEDLLGFSYGQFTRTVLLAQGRFAEFLKAGVNERAELLERLTGTGIYARISERVYARKVEEDAAVADLARRLGEVATLADDERLAMRERLEASAGRLAALEAERALWTRLDDLSRQVAETAADLEAKERDAARAREAASEASRARAAAEAALRDELPRLKEIDDEIRRAASLDAVVERLREDSTRAEEARAEADRNASELEQAGARLERESSSLTESVAKAREWMDERARLAPVAKEWARVEVLLASCEEKRTVRAALEAESAELEGASLDLRKGIESLREETAPLERLVEGRDPDAIVEATKEARALEADLQTAIRRQSHLDRLRRSRSEEGVARAESQAADLAERSASDACETALAIVERSREAVSEAASRMRSSLRPGEECPVCGSREHPRAGDDDERLAAVFEAQDRELASRRTALELARAAAAQARANLALIGRRLLEEEAASRDLPEPSPGLRERIASWTLEESLARLAGEAEEASARVRELEELQGRAHELLRGRGEIARREERLEATRARLEDLRARLEAARAGFEEAASQVDSFLGGAAWRERWQADPRAWRSDMSVKVVAWNEREDEARRGTERLATVAELRAQLAPQLEGARNATREASRRLEGLREEWRARSEERAAMIGGLSVDQARERKERREEELRGALERAHREHQDGQLRIATLEGAVRSQGERLETLRRDLSSAAPAELAGLGADAVRSGIGERVAALDEAVRECVKESERDRLALESDDRSRATAGELAARLAERKVARDRWSALSEAIGSSDGRKFRRVAQQFTLATLLEEGNRQLSMLAPRYELRRVDNTMAFGVVDRDAWGEFRPVQTLSGGETFLVSLALALALSRLSGSDHALESLFIDEGFGTLDPETLRGVMNALSHLRSQGRQVGLITHVEELKELIPVRVEVERLGGGSSRLRVVG